MMAVIIWTKKRMPTATAIFRRDMTPACVGAVVVVMSFLLQWGW